MILGSCKQVTIGPTAVMSLLVYETCGNDFASCAVLTGFYAGIFELLMALLQLGKYCLPHSLASNYRHSAQLICLFFYVPGWVVSFISESVVIGFTAGASTTIISSQIKNFFGISGSKGSGFVGYWTAVFRDINTISVGDCCVGISSFVILFFLRVNTLYKSLKLTK